MNFHKKAAFIAVLCALPFMALATWFWIAARNPSPFADTLYQMGDALFQLGFPLTTFLFVFLLAILGGNFNKETEILALPFINLTFLIQWIIWSQIIIHLKVEFKKLK